MLRVSDDFLEHVDFVSTFIMVNLLWVLCALPLVTLPAATAGLFAVTGRMARGEASNVYSTFFEAARDHWRTSTALMLLNLAVGAVIAANLSILPMMSSFHPMTILSRSVTLFAVLFLLMINGYAWPLMVTQLLTLRPLLQQSAQKVFTSPLRATALVLAWCLPLGISLFLPHAALVLFTFAAVALSVSWIAQRPTSAAHMKETSTPSRDIV